MYAIVQLGSSQFKVSEGDIINADKIESEIGKNIELDKVLMFANGDDVRIGKPYLKDVKVSAKVEKHLSGPKVIAFKFQKRKSEKTTIGHRHKFTALNITKISA